MKRFYARTNKNRFVRQITKQQRRQHILRKIAQRKLRLIKESNAAANSTNVPVSSSPNNVPTSSRDQGELSYIHATPITRPAVLSPSLSISDKDHLPFTPPEQHYHMSASNAFPLDLSTFVQQRPGDPALTVRIRNS